MKPYIGVYTDLAKAFESRSLAGLQSVLRSHADALRSDDNWGLAGQVEEALTERMVQGLTQTYLTLSLEDIARKVGLASAAEAEAVVLRLSRQGKIAASIDLAHGGKVEFLGSGSAVTGELLDARIREAVALIEKVKQMDHALQLEKTFLAKSLKSAGGRISLDVE